MVPLSDSSTATLRYLVTKESCLAIRLKPYSTAHTTHLLERSRQTVGLVVVNLPTSKHSSNTNEIHPLIGHMHTKKVHLDLPSLPRLLETCRQSADNSMVQTSQICQFVVKIIPPNVPASSRALSALGLSAATTLYKCILTTFMHVPRTARGPCTLTCTMRSRSGSK